MKAKDIMTRDVVTVSPATPVREAVALLAEHRVTSLPVVDEVGDVVGIVSELDLLRGRVPHDPRSHLRPHPDVRPDPPQRVGDVMTSPVVCLSENADTADLAAVLAENNVRAVPIISGPDLVGIVSRRDVLRTLLRDDTAVEADVRSRLAEFSQEAGRWPVTVRDGVVTISVHGLDERLSQAVAALAQTVPGAIRVHLRT